MSQISPGIPQPNINDAKGKPVVYQEQVSESHDPKIGSEKQNYNKLTIVGGHSSAFRINGNNTLVRTSGLVKAKLPRSSFKESAMDMFTPGTPKVTFTEHKEQSGPYNYIVYSDFDPKKSTRPQNTIGRNNVYMQMNGQTKFGEKGIAAVYTGVPDGDDVVIDTSTAIDPTIEIIGPSTKLIEKLESEGKKLDNDVIEIRTGWADSPDEEHSTKLMLGGNLEHVDIYVDGEKFEPKLGKNNVLEYFDIKNDQIIRTLDSKIMNLTP